MGSKAHFEGKDILFYAGIFLSIFIVFSFLKKLFYRIWLQRNFLMFPSLNIHTISNISMIIAKNTAIIFAIVFLTHNLLGVIFQVYPGSRLLIETILIKIGGSLYGPAVGQIGRSFRNEVSPGKGIFRTKEFEQLELEEFISASNSEKTMLSQKREIERFLTTVLNFSKASFEFRETKTEELPHYSLKNIDLYYNFEFG
ncbi:hypothetical protein PVNG_02406 [Plasmodium vivax North Korean]|uniref:Aminoacyl-transfer RNA synthetases class-II family profile domain-containing protein n=1 Tax=Plasmodium vivax North Korean TaxID=1035514 RepID=A0A0J9W6Q8_PLAVI|nr:hypothetical protein PVNG_02406 [Plasmodium vivax North Korean]